MSKELKASDLIYFNEETIQKRKAKKIEEISEIIKEALVGYDFEFIKLIENKGDEPYIIIDYNFTLDNYTQEDSYCWGDDESLSSVVCAIKKRINYIKELREQYPLLAKQNDFIQTNRTYKKQLVLTEMGYERIHNIKLELCDYMKLPNRTSCSIGGGDYEIKRTPKRVKEYNDNIDKTIMFMIECISELKSMKYELEEVNDEH